MGVLHEGDLSGKPCSFFFFEKMVLENKILCVRRGFLGVDGWQVNLVKIPVSIEELKRRPAGKPRLCRVISLGPSVHPLAVN